MNIIKRNKLICNLEFILSIQNILKLHRWIHQTNKFLSKYLQQRYIRSQRTQERNCKKDHVQFINKLGTIFLKLANLLIT